MAKFSGIVAFAVVGMLFAGCSSEEDEVVPEITPVKKVEAPAPQAVAEPETAPKPEMPELQSIESLSANSTAGQGTFTTGSAPQPGTEGAVVIQVSIQPSKSAAQAVLKKLEEKGIKAYLAQVENPGELEGSYYRVRVGYFKKIDDAKAYGKAALEPLGFAWWIDNKANDTVGTPATGETSNSYRNSDSYNNSGSYTSSTPAEEPPSATEASSASEAPAAPAVAEQPATEPAPLITEPAPAEQPAPAPAQKTEATQAPAAQPAPAEESAQSPKTTEEVYDDWE